MPKWLRVSLISLGSLILLIAIGVFILVKSFKKPDILATDSILTMTDDGKTLGKTTIRLSNPNLFSIKIDSLHYTLKIHGKTYLIGKKDSTILIPRNGFVNIRIPFVLESDAMDKDFVNEDSAVNHFHVTAKVSALFVKEFPVSLDFSKNIAFLKKPILISDENYLNMDNTGLANVTLRLHLVNPNKYSLALDTLTYSLKIEGHQYVTGQKLKQIKFGPLDTQIVNLPLTFRFKEFMNNFKGRDTANFHFVFDGLLSTPDIKYEHFTIPLNKELPLVTDFNVEVEHVKINKFGFNYTDLTALVKFGNPNPSDFDATGLHYDLSVDGIEWVKGSHSQEVKLPQKSAIELNFPIHLDMKNISKSAKDYLNGKTVQNYKVHAVFYLKTKDPKMKKVKMDIQNSGVLHLKDLTKKK